MTESTGRNLAADISWGVPVILLFAASLFFITETANHLQLSLNLSSLGNYYFATDSYLSFIVSVTFFGSCFVLYTLYILDYSPFSLLQFIHDTFLIFQMFPIILLFVCKIPQLTIFLIFPILAFYVNQLVPIYLPSIRLLVIIPFVFSVSIVISIDLFCLKFLSPFSIGVHHTVSCGLGIVALILFSKDGVEGALSNRLWLGSALAWAIGNSDLYYFVSHLPERVVVNSGETHQFFQNSILLLFIVATSTLCLAAFIQMSRDENPTSEIIVDSTSPSGSPQIPQNEFPSYNQYLLFTFITERIKGLITPNNPYNYIWMERLRISLFLQKKAISHGEMTNNSLSNVEVEYILKFHPLLSSVMVNPNRDFPIRKQFCLGNLLSKAPVNRGI